MFDLFGPKKRDQQQKVKTLLKHRSRVLRLAILVIEGKVEPFKIYDLKMLGGLSKAQVETSGKVWLEACKLNPELAIPEVDLPDLLPKLAQFQPGVGPNPLGINPYAIAAMDPKTQMKQMQTICATAKMPDDTMRARVNAERERLRREVSAITGQAYTQPKKKIDFDKFFVATPPREIPSGPKSNPRSAEPSPTSSPPSTPTPAPAPAPTIHTQGLERKRLPLGLHKKRKPS